LNLFGDIFKGTCLCLAKILVIIVGWHTVNITSCKETIR
jgi:hypothetical protein